MWRLRERGPLAPSVCLSSCLWVSRQGPLVDVFVEDQVVFQIINHGQANQSTHCASAHHNHATSPIIG